MLTVEKIWEGPRLEGLNYGLPTTFLKFGLGVPYTIEDLVRDILMKTRCKWVCIFGEDPTQVGTGSLIKGLTSIGRYTEVECSGRVRDPKYLHTVDRWIVDYTPNGLFNYSALRDRDMIRWTITKATDLSVVKSGLEEQKLFGGTKVLKVVGTDTAEVLHKCFEISKGYERVRVYACTD